jgi:hypothetical protein
MSQHETTHADAHTSSHHTDEASSDGTVDAIAAVLLISIAVVTMIYWVSLQEDKSPMQTG